VRVLVIGRGVFGLAAALSIRRSGHHVVVVGTRDPHAASEDTSRIIRNDYAGDVFHTTWADEAIEGWHRWNVEAPVPLFANVGLANLTLEPMSPTSFAGASYHSLPNRPRLDPVGITELLGFLTPGRFVDGYRNDAAGWANASETVRYMERMCEIADVGIVAERAAQIGDGWVGLTDDGLLRADRVVVAAGAWTPTLVPETAELLIPAAQPVLYLRPTDPAPFTDVPVWALDLARSGFYGFPASADGIVKVGHHGPGITRRLGATSVPESVIGRFRDFFRESVPALAGARIERSRLCFYCDAPDARFVVDAVPGRRRVFVAAGGSGHGFKFAPVLGELIAAVVNDVDHPRRSQTAWRSPGRTGDVARSVGLGGTTN
jgi:sarcosine oxidase / L-pipecolate oxidase